MLTNKYLRYSPEITLEIFTLVWNKLFDNGWTEYSNKSLNDSYSEFSRKFNHLVPEVDIKEFNTHVIERPGQTETTVQEILGYDPFVKEDFILPEKWCIKRNNSRINEWLNKNNSSGSTYESLRNDYAHIPSIKGYHLFEHIQNGYTEITFEQFKKYVLKEPIETSKEAIPEYVECINVATCNTKVGEIFKCRQIDNSFEWEYNNKNIKDYSSWDGWGEPWSSELPQKHFKPSTKEAFDAQNKPIEKWSVGSYAVAMEGGVNWSGTEVGDIYIIRSSSCADNITKSSDGENLCFSTPKKPEHFQWFATLQEAEIFAKTLIEPVEEEVKQPLKQAVHCKTQEEWDFVLSKINYKLPKDTFRPGCDSIVIKDEEDKNNIGCVATTFHLKGIYQILSFQEWCDLNGYKMKKEVKFEVGKWYKYNKWYLNYLRHDDKVFVASEYISDDKEHHKQISRFGINDESKVLVLIEEIQQYLPDDHPDKITPIIQQAKDMQSRNNLKKGDYLYVLLPNYCGDILEITGIQDESKYEPDSIWISHKNRSFSGGGFRCNDKIYPFGESFRLATSEEINNHLISIGQIADLTKQESEKYPFKPIRPGDLEWKIEVPTFITNLQMGVTVKDPFYGITGKPCKDVLTRGQCKLNLLSTESEIKIIIKSKNKIKI